MSPRRMETNTRRCRMTTNAARSKKQHRARAKAGPRKGGGPAWWMIAVGVLAAIAVLAAIYVANRPKTSAGSYRYAVGTPGPGLPAPNFQLPSADGSTVDLQSL